MSVKRLASILRKNFYQYINVKPKELEVNYQIQDGIARVVLLIDYHSRIIISKEGVERIRKQIENLFFYPNGRIPGITPNKPVHEVELFTVVFTENVTAAKTLCETMEDYWIVDSAEKKIIVYEDQPVDFHGLYHLVEESFVEPKKKQPVVLISLIAVNILIFIVLKFIGDTSSATFMSTHGGLLPREILKGNDYYTLFTSMFLHYDVSHLLNNMFILFAVGEFAERHLGKVGFLSIYLASGILGNLASVWYYSTLDGNIVSLGASGAVFGMVGALSVIVLVHKGNVEGITIGRMGIMIGLSLYLGFASQGVNNAAHVGGLIAGIILTGAWYIFMQNKNIINGIKYLLHKRK